MKAVLLVLLALLIPACGHSDPGGADLPPGGIGNPQEINLDVANADSVPYNLSAWEFVNNVPTTQILVCWPIPGKGLDPFSQQSRSIAFSADSPTITHFIGLYSTSGTVLEFQPFVKGPGQLFIAITIQNAKMDIQTVQF